jgi:hypothetical protein
MRSPKLFSRAKASVRKVKSINFDQLYLLMYGGFTMVIIVALLGQWNVIPFKFTALSSPDMEVVSISSTSSGDQANIYVGLKNKAYDVTRTVEACVVPRTWAIKEGLITVPWAASAVPNFCPMNDFCQTKQVTVPMSSVVTEIFEPKIPSYDTVDHCFGRGSAFDQNLNYMIVVNVYDQTYHPISRGIMEFKWGT